MKYIKNKKGEVGSFNELISSNSQKPFMSKRLLALLLIVCFVVAIPCQVSAASDVIQSENSISTSKKTQLSEKEETDEASSIGGELLKKKLKQQQEAAISEEDEQKQDEIPELGSSVKKSKPDFYSTYKPGKGLFVSLPGNYSARYSLGYKAYKKDPQGNKVYGFVTCAHNSDARASNYILNSAYLQDAEAVGIFYEDGISDASGNTTMDYSFIVPSRSYEISNTTESGVKITGVAKPVKGTEVWQEGQESGKKSSKVSELDTTKEYTKADGSGELTFEHLAKTNTCFAAGGDSGGIVYDKNNKVVGTITGGVEGEYALFTRADYLESEHNIYYYGGSETNPESEMSGKCGANVTWKYDSNSKTLTISGTGDMYNMFRAPWADHAIDKVVISNGVTSIGDYAFYNLNVSDVRIGKDVKRIGVNAFAWDRYLKKIDIPASVTSIGRHAFFRSKMLKEINFLGKQPEINSKAFDGLTLTAYYKDTYSYDTKKYGGTITWSKFKSNSLYSATIGAISAQTYTGSEIKPTPKVTLGGKTLVKDVDYNLKYEDNVNLGTATVIVEGKGNYTDTVKKTFTIRGKSLSNATIEFNAEYIYTGSEIKPTPKVKLNGKTLVKDKDYYFEYSNNIAVGDTAMVIVRGKGNYSSSTFKYFRILQAPIKCATIAIVADQTYTGSDIKPTPTVKLDGKTLVKDTDYTLSYINNKNVGTATVTVTGKGCYTDNAKKTFKIVQSSVSSASLTSISAYTYSGGECKPTPKVTVNSKTLVNGTDYTLSYNNNKNAGTATVTVTGKGNYKGTYKKNFTIAQKSISSATIGSISDQAYTGSAITPTPTVKLGSKALVKNTDYTLSYSNNQKLGTATVTVTGKGNYTGTAKKTFKIVQKSVSGATIASISDYTYSGSECKPTPKVTVGGKTLVNKTDYTLSYKNNKNAGTATVTITGKGNYKNTVSKTFKIKAKSLSNATISSVSSQTYTGSAIKPTPTVKLDGKKLVKGTDYYFEYSNNTLVGDAARITVKGKGNYTSSKTIYFKIKQRDINGLTVKTGDAQYTYTGSEIKPTVTVKFNATTLTKGTHYTVTYSNNKNVGTATITIKGKGNYTGTKKATFKIVPKAPTGLTVSGYSSTVNQIKWNSVSGATGYEVWRKNGNGSYTKIYSGTSTRTYDSSVYPGLTCTYYVKAYKKVSGTTYTSNASSTKTIKK